MSSPEEQDLKPKAHWFKRLRAHPIFLLLLFPVASKIIGEFYPISPYSMYSDPSPIPLIYCYLADGDGEALPIQYHSGQSSSRITKRHKKERTLIYDRIEDASGREEEDLTHDEDMEVRREAGIIVLEYVYLQSLKRSEKKHLTLPIQLVEVKIGIDEDTGHLKETPRFVARYEEGDVPAEATPES